MKIKINVKTNSLVQKIEKISEGEYKIFLKEIPEKNRANAELLKLLKKYFRREVKLIKGRTSRNKIVEVKND